MKLRPSLRRYLNEFVAPPPGAAAAADGAGDAPPWLHLDLMACVRAARARARSRASGRTPSLPALFPPPALPPPRYNTASRPGRPEGGEAMGVRALFALLQARFGS